MTYARGLMWIRVDFENMAKKIQEYASLQQHTDAYLPEHQEILALVLQREKVCQQACKELTKEFAQLEKQNQ